MGFLDAREMIHKTSDRPPPELNLGGPTRRITSVNDGEQRHPGQEGGVPSSHSGSLPSRARDTRSPVAVKNRTHKIN